MWDWIHICVYVSVLGVLVSAEPRLQPGFRRVQSNASLVDPVYGVHVYDNHEPEDILMLHMPCKQSNVFDITCKCHVYCTDETCANAKQICKNLPDCKHVIKRRRGKPYATLKRDPTPEEIKRLHLGAYSGTANQMYKQRFQNLKDRKSSHVTLQNLVDDPDARKVLDNIASSPSSTLCGQTAAMDGFLQKRIAIVALNYHTPYTLKNSLLSWNNSGLLSLVDERKIILNDPYPSEEAMSYAFNFEVVQPKDISNALTVKHNVMTIGAAFYYAMHLVTADYVLFLEKDFKMDESLPLSRVKAELLASAAMLDKGAQVIRMRSRKELGCDTFRTCTNRDMNWDGANTWQRRTNWYAYYCKSTVRKGVADCLSWPYYRCFTSWDTNWTLNGVMVKRSTANGVRYRTKFGEKSLSELGLHWGAKQDAFETGMLNANWGKWDVPICISYEGMFIHEEIDG